MACNSSAFYAINRTLIFFIILVELKSKTFFMSVKLFYNLKKNVIIKFAFAYMLKNK